ncbi:BlaI/MecI/CopY family transcriptional regulator [Phaeacidiphilus oryzae]|uniref:BlaI/MecI/CopY family transcriptional regulator n=1 Tax=Phaeacidiphilus oryzae TaxID=348818 RepID=UPI00056550B6|nr:BlaI/MecI/CopY family transcriptional regulator [Phaeacidiphilus oryzae]
MARQLGELENEIMTRVWQWNRPVMVREVLEDLLREREIAYTTVMTVMDKLYQKGWLRRDREGRAYRYEPVSTREAYTAALMNDAWATADNPAAALVHFFGMMTPEQQESLRDALRVLSPETDSDQTGSDESAPDSPDTPDSADTGVAGGADNEKPETGTSR